MKILYAIKGLGLGGAEMHVVQCAAAMKNRGHEVEVGYCLPWKGHLVTQLEDAKIPVHCWGEGARWWSNSLPRASATLHAFRPDVVHAHLPVTGMLMRMLKRRYGYRLVYTEHITQQLLHPLTKAAHRVTWAIDDAAISCSQGVADSLSRKSLVVDNALRAEPPPPASPSVRELLDLPSGARVWLCVANFRPQKNHEMLLRAFDQATNIGGLRNWHLALVGQDASERKRCEAIAAALGARDQIHFLGRHDNAAALMSEVDGFCLSSIEEGLPIALLEAMRAGVPVVVTDVGGMPQVVTDECGKVVRSRDQDGFAAALTELSSDDALRASLGQGARCRFIDAYTEVAMLDSLELTYQGRA